MGTTEPESGTTSPTPRKSNDSYDSRSTSPVSSKPERAQRSPSPTLEEHEQEQEEHSKPEVVDANSSKNSTVKEKRNDWDMFADQDVDSNFDVSRRIVNVALSSAETNLSNAFAFS